jgi:hypothetical protein
MAAPRTVKTTMDGPDLSYSAWMERRECRPQRLLRLDASLPPFRRLRLRSPGEAAFLRRIGTPAALVGPIWDR